MIAGEEGEALRPHFEMIGGGTNKYSWGRIEWSEDMKGGSKEN